jgi:hypothetical protein
MPVRETSTICAFGCPNSWTVNTVVASSIDLTVTTCGASSEADRCPPVRPGAVLIREPWTNSILSIGSVDRYSSSRTHGDEVVPPARKSVRHIGDVKPFGRQPRSTRSSAIPRNVAIQAPFDAPQSLPNRTMTVSASGAT